jgi:hypothetical protein
LDDASLSDLVSRNNQYGLHSSKKVFPTAIKPNQNGEILVDGIWISMPDLTNYYLLHLAQESDIDQAIIDYKSDSHVVGALRNSIGKINIIPNDPLYENVGENLNQWSLPQISAPEGWDIDTGSSDVTIAIVDSGVDWNHEDLLTKLKVNLGEDGDNDGTVIEYLNGEWVLDPDDLDGVDDDNNGFIDDLIGYDFISANLIPPSNERSNPNPSPNGLDDNGNGLVDEGVTHGTLVAGIAAASTNNIIGISGVDWIAKVLPIQVCDDEGNCPINSIVNGILFAVQSGADVINLSLGVRETLVDGEPNLDEETFWSRLMEAAYNHGTLVVAAAGNDFADFDDPDIRRQWPLCADGGNNRVVGVGATSFDDFKSSYSNMSSEYIDISAPGDYIISTKYYDGSPLFSEYYTDENDIINMFGTSLSTPMVSGTLSLLKSLNPAITSLDFFINKLKHAADIIAYIEPAYYEKMGYGRLNIEKTLGSPKPNIGLYSVSIDDGTPEAGETYPNGNGNGVPEDGENVNLSFEIGNNWLELRDIETSISAHGDNSQYILSIINPPTGPTAQFHFLNTSEGNINESIFNYGVELETYIPLEENRVEFYLHVSGVYDTDSEFSDDLLFSIPVNAKVTTQAGWPQLAGTVNSHAVKLAYFQDPFLYGFDSQKVVYGGGGGTIVFNGNGSTYGTWGSGGEQSDAVYACPAVGDIDGDGDVEVININPNGVYVFDSDGTFIPKSPSNPVHLDDCQFDENAYPVLANVTGGPQPEILFTLDCGGQVYLHVLNSATDIIWVVAVGSPGDIVKAGPSVGDINGDGENDIVVVLSDSGVGYRHTLYVYNGNGTRNGDGGFSDWADPNSELHKGAIQGPIVLANIGEVNSSDPESLDIIYLTVDPNDPYENDNPGPSRQNGRLNVLDGYTGKMLPLPEFDHVQQDNQGWYTISNSSLEENDYNSSYPIKGIPLYHGYPQATVADMDLDGDLEIVVPSGGPLPAATVWVFNADGSYNNNGPILTGHWDSLDIGPTLANLDGTGDLDITTFSWIFDGNARGTIQVFRNDGTILGTGFPLSLSGPLSFNFVLTAPAVYDMDGDGDLEILQPRMDGAIAAYDVVFQTDSEWWNDLQWNQFQHDSRNTGNYHNGRPGDARMSGVLNDFDTMAIVEEITANTILEPYEKVVADINHDQVIDVQNIVVLSGLIMSGDEIPRQHPTLRDSTAIVLNLNPGSSLTRGAGGVIELSIETMNPIFGMQLEIQLPENVVVEEIETIGIAEHFLANYGIQNDIITIVFYDYENSGFGPGEGVYANIFLDNNLARSQEATINIISALVIDIDGTHYNVNYGQPQNHIIDIPFEFSLYNAYPNPFNPVTNIRYDIAEYSDVTITVYNLLGRKVSTLYKGRRQPGAYQLEWNSSNDFGVQVSSGVYFIKMEANSNSQKFVKEQKVILLK